MENAFPVPAVKAADTETFSDTSTPATMTFASAEAPIVVVSVIVPEVVAEKVAVALLAVPL
jgi:hypothetical protein